MKRTVAEILVTVKKIYILAMVHAVISAYLGTYNFFPSHIYVPKIYHTYIYIIELQNLNAFRNGRRE